MSWMDRLKYDEKGLIPVVIQDYWTRTVLMVAYMNREALEKTIDTKRTYFYSRSRGGLWPKGKTSGFTQSVKGIYVDCDSDCLLIKVAQRVGACHNGYRSCFYRRVSEETIKTVGRKVFDPEKVYRKVKN
ncbi:MAG: phosphoribosyl-AMP cyclohydrolase [Candidatus Omnitrophota bacterium]|nr:MAG: phosphoribosyl-AMP cyclohydrolase [Candidatus Omnitrophota bacterium]